jgi:hypothetical protein
MNTSAYMSMMETRRETYTGIQRTWADFNMELEIIDSDAANAKKDLSIIESAIADCKIIIDDLASQHDDDALNIKQNQLAELESIVN